MNESEDPEHLSQRDTRSAAAHAAGDDEGWVGPYHLIERLGEGGMGEVWSAEQARPLRRRVAIKFVRAGMDSVQVMARFDAERQALALMDHPNVARVIDAGTTRQGRPYFVMDYVRGVPLTQHCDTQRLSTRDRLELFLQVCEGVRHAHQKGVIHRDLKPSNVLVEFVDGHAVAKIIDFGVAKAVGLRLADHTLLTALGAFVGTPEYMSPEQAGTTPQDVDTRADVYSLGVLLYELLVGELPLDGRELRRVGVEEMLRRIREVDPPKPSSRASTVGDDARRHATDRGTQPEALKRQLVGDLDWIVMRALDKNRERRYAGASELAADLQRHLRNEPVLAGPPSALYRAGKFARRNRGALIVWSGSMLLVGGLLSLGVREYQARSAAEVLRERARELAALDSLRADPSVAASSVQRRDLAPFLRRIREGTASAAEEERILLYVFHRMFVGEALQETSDVSFRLVCFSERAFPASGLSCELTPEIYCDGVRISDTSMVTWFNFEQQDYVRLPLIGFARTVGAHDHSGRVLVRFLSEKRRDMRDYPAEYGSVSIPPPTALTIPALSYVIVSSIPKTYPVLLSDRSLADEIQSAIQIEPLKLDVGPTGRVTRLTVRIREGPASPLLAIEVSLRGKRGAGWLPVLAFNGKKGSWSPSLSVEFDRNSRPPDYLVDIPAATFAPSGDVVDVRIRSDRNVALARRSGSSESMSAYVDVDFVRRVPVAKGRKW